MRPTRSSESPVLQPIGDSIWISEGSCVYFRSPYPTRMVLVRLESAALGGGRGIEPNKLHHRESRRSFRWAFGARGAAMAPGDTLAVVN